MNLIKDIQNTQKLSVGEHSLEEVVELASNDETSDESEKCPECHGNLRHSYFANGLDDYDQEWECLGCGNTWTT